MAQEEEGITVQQAFDQLDQDQDGLINAQELAVLLPQVIQAQVTEDDCENLINQVAVDGGGKISYQQFEILVNSLQQEPGQEEEEQEELVKYLNL
jgi:Ca2+-binding EF-hand superfamily protein